MKMLSQLILFYLLLLLLFVMLFFVWILLKQWRRMSNESNLARRKQRFQIMMRTYLTTPSAYLPRMKLKGSFREWALNQLILYKEESLIHDNDRFLQVLKECEYYLEIELFLNDRRWWRRLEGLYRVEVFQLVEQREKVKELLNVDNHPFVRLKAFSAMGIVGNIKDLLDLVIFLEQSNYNFQRLDYVIHVLESLESRDDINTSQEILMAYNHVQAPFVRRCLIELIGRKGFRDLDWFLIEKLQDNAPEIRIGAMKSLMELKVTHALPMLIELLKWSESDDVKIVAIKAIVSLGKEQYRHVMIDNVAHSLWWVRFYSALGLANLGEEGKSQLETLSQVHPDKYARQMMFYILQTLNTGKEERLWN